MKPFVTIMLALLCSSAFAKPPAIGEKLPAGAELFTIAGHRAPVITDTGATLEAFRIKRDGAHYIVGVDQSYTIGYITLDGDRTSKTPEGIALGSALSVVTTATKHAPIKVSGWAYYFPLPSGWNAAFIGSPQDPTPAGLPRNAKADFLFKSRTAKR